MKTEKITIPLGSIAENTCNKIARERHGLIQNWRVAKPATSGWTGQVHTHDCGRYSGRCRYTKHEYTPTLQAWGVVIKDGKVFAGRIGKTGFRLVAPKGYAFGDDAHGVKIYAISNSEKDFHFNTDHVQSDHPVRAIMAALRANWQRQAEVRKLAVYKAREQRIYDREVGSVRVTLQDSRRAGNCVEGSLRYAEAKLGVTREQVLAGDYLFSVPASRVLKANGDTRAAAAVRIAWLRETTVSI